MQDIFPIIIKKNGDLSFAKFPVELEAGDTLAITKPVVHATVPVGFKWAVAGFSQQGPIINAIPVLVKPNEVTSKIEIPKLVIPPNPQK